MSKRWFYSKNGQSQGSVTEEQLKALLGSGSVQKDDLLWCEGMAGWQAAAEFPELFPIVASAAKRYCDHCGEPGNWSSHFCGSCGLPFSATANAAPPGPVAPAQVAAQPLKAQKLSPGFRRAAIAVGLACITAIAGVWMFLRGTPADNATISVTVDDSISGAIEHAIARAIDKNRQSAPALALWKDAQLGSGVVLATTRKNSPDLGDCQEFVVSFFTDEEQSVIADFGQVACSQSADGFYRVHPEIPVAIDDAQRQLARSLLPPGTLAAGQAWPIAVGRPAPKVSSDAAAIATALNSGQAPSTQTWTGTASKGALYLYPSKDSPTCRSLLSRATPVSSRGSQVFEEYCPYREGPMVGWIRTDTKAASAAEMAVAQPLLDQAVKSLQ
jgi:hypothetical protein